MLKTRNEILALFNRSASGKSYIAILDGIMFIITVVLYEMVAKGDIERIEFAEDGKLDLKATDGTVTTVKTAKVKTFTESQVLKLRAANQLIVEAEAFDADKYAAAQKKLQGIVL